MSKPHLLLLHGALAAAGQMDVLRASFEARFHCHAFHFEGHGGTPLPAEGLSMTQMAAEIVQYMDNGSIKEALVLGYSMGGYAAILAALRFPGRFSKVVTLGTKFDWNAETALRETALLVPEVMEQKIPQFVEQLARDQAPNDWRQVVRATARMMEALGAQPDLDAAALRQVDIPVLVAVGDRDYTAGVEASRMAVSLMPQAQLQVLSDSRHPLHQTNMAQFNAEALTFFAG